MDLTHLDPSMLALQAGYLFILILLVGVTGGIGYLTLANWRDKRRQMEATPPRRQPSSKSKRK